MTSVFNKLIQSPMFFNDLKTVIQGIYKISFFAFYQKVKSRFDQFSSKYDRIFFFDYLVIGLILGMLLINMCYFAYLIYLYKRIFQESADVLMLFLEIPKKHVIHFYKKAVIFWNFSEVK